MNITTEQNVTYFFEPAERGRLCVIRVKAPHYTGVGEVVARNVELELAKRICILLNNGPGILEDLKAIFGQASDFISGHASPQARLETIDGLCREAIAKAEGRS